MTEVRLHEEAEEEFLEAIRYYVQRSRAVATRFVDEVRAGLESISEFPDMGPRISGQIRRKVLKSYPYSLIYVIVEDEILVLAVMRDNRRPGYWKRRI